MTYEKLQTLNIHHPLPPIAAVVFALAVTVLKWEQRRQTRRALKRLDAHMLSDIGLSLSDAETEVAKPYWRD